MINWRKSSRSGGGNDDACVELAESGDRVVWVRDSKDPDGERLTFGRDAFAGLLERVKRGELAL